MKKLTKTEVLVALKELHGWEYVDATITTTYTFKDFKEAFSIMTYIAFECEIQGHHPNWSNTYNTLTIKLNTHDVNGVTKKDFKLAHSIEKIISKT